MIQETIPLQTLMRAFPGIPDVEARELLASGAVRSYPRDTVLCHEDQYESIFYIILEGEVQVSKMINSEQVRYLTRLMVGDFFGELALIHDAPRAATVTTTCPSVFIEIHKDAFNQLLRRSASLSRALVREVSSRLRENDAMAIEDLRLKAGELATAYQLLAEQEYTRREFLTTIAHELRTPLTAASGFLQMIQMGQLEGDALQSGLNSVGRNIHQIISLVNDILFVQEMDLILPRFQPLDLVMMLRQILDAYGAEAHTSQVVMQLEVEPNLGLVNGDAKSLERAFSALVDNAIKFSPDGGKVNIHAYPDEEGLVVTVQDEGVGIPPDVLPRVFDRFFHIDQIGGRLFRGVGLGLSIARQVIEQHSGRISIESEINQGTRVIVHLKR